MVYMANLGIEAILFLNAGQNAYILWFTGTAVSVILDLIPVSLAFLGLERCLGIHLPFFNLVLVDYGPVSGFLSAFDNLIVAFLYRNCFNKIQIAPMRVQSAFISSITCPR
uniref:G protein-coupled receptor n=1 Tax=Panagrellus redivivus TaxID=6233 RepID=A0A7E4W0G7_PANRE